MASVARSSEHKEVSCGRWGVHGRGLLNLIIHIHAKRVFWTLPLFLECPFPLNATCKAASALLVPSPSPSDAQRTNTRPVCNPFYTL